MGATQPDLQLFRGWLEPPRADLLLAQLMDETQWRHDSITLFGKVYPVPRLQAWYGDPGARYSYSSLALEPVGWTPTLANVRERIEELSHARFNSVLVNLYRDGHDSNGWHADDEPELGSEPVIASLSLGVSRVMKFRRRDRTATFDLALHNGDVVVMYGDSQSDWQHTIAKSRRISEPRINLTFRYIQAH